MALAVVQRVFVQSSGTAASVTTAGITTTSGNLLVAIPMCNGAHMGATPTDSLGNTWQTAIAAVGTTGRAAMFYVPNCAGGAAHTFSFASTGGNGLLVLLVYEISGANTSSPLNGTNSAVNSTASHNSGNITSGGSVPEIFVGAMAISTGAVGPYLPASPTSGTDWAGLSGLFDGANEGGCTAFRIVPVNTTDAFAISMSGSSAEAILIAGFKDASAAAASTPFLGAESPIIQWPGGIARY